jgi:hypothetical protein
VCNNPQKEEDFKKKYQKIEKLQLHMFATLISLIGCHFFLGWHRFLASPKELFNNSSLRILSVDAHWENDHPNR